MKTATCWTLCILPYSLSWRFWEFHLYFPQQFEKCNINIAAKNQLSQKFNKLLLLDEERFSWNLKLICAGVDTPKPQSYEDIPFVVGKINVILIIFEQF